MPLAVTSDSETAVPPAGTVHKRATEEELRHEFWPACDKITIPTWSEELESIANPHGTLRTQPKHVPIVEGLDNKLLLACAARGIDPTLLDFWYCAEDETKVLCVVCQQAIAGNTRDVDRHLRTTHHICNIVYNLWIDRDQLLKGEEPYSCPFCSKTVTYRLDRISSHMKECRKKPAPYGGTNENELANQGSAKEDDSATGVDIEDSLAISQPSPPDVPAPASTPLPLNVSAPASPSRDRVTDGPVPFGSDVSPVPADGSTELSDSQETLNTQKSSKGVEKPRKNKKRRVVRKEDKKQAMPKDKKQAMPKDKKQAKPKQYRKSPVKDYNEKMIAVDEMIRSLKPGEEKPAYVPEILAALHRKAELKLKGKEVEQAIGLHETDDIPEPSSSTTTCATSSARLTRKRKRQAYVESSEDEDEDETQQVEDFQEATLEPTAIDPAQAYQQAPASFVLPAAALPQSQVAANPLPFHQPVPNPSFVSLEQPDIPYLITSSQPLLPSTSQQSQHYVPNFNTRQQPLLNLNPMIPNFNFNFGFGNNFPARPQQMQQVQTMQTMQQMQQANFLASQNTFIPEGLNGSMPGSYAPQQFMQTQQALTMPALDLSLPDPATLARWQMAMQCMPAFNNQNFNNTQNMFNNSMNNNMNSGPYF